MAKTSEVAVCDNGTTYEQIYWRVVNTHGFKPKDCWIAHVKSDYGLLSGQAKNRHTPRAEPC